MTIYIKKNDTFYGSLKLNLSTGTYTEFILGGREEDCLRLDFFPISFAENIVSIKVFFRIFA